jgi:hypothetical protein
MTDALDTPEGAAFATEIVEMLEAELVRFQHRVAFDHGIELDRARAAMVLLGKLVAAGVNWTAKPDCDPTRLYELFDAMRAKHPAIAPALKKELAAFFVATTDVEVVEDTAETPAAILRRAGASPAHWRWAAAHADAARCWAACADDVDRSVQVALAFGVAVELVAQALARAFALLATRLRTRYPAQRTALVTSLGTIAEDAEQAAAITKLAFEMRLKDQQATDPLTELSIHAFQLADALQSMTDAPDVERFGTLAGRADPMFTSRGIQLAVMVRKELDAAVAQSIETG